MSSGAIQYLNFIFMFCCMVRVAGAATVWRMPLGISQRVLMDPAIVSGLISSGIVAVFLVPSIYLRLHRKEAADEESAEVAYA